MPLTQQQERERRTLAKERIRTGELLSKESGSVSASYGDNDLYVPCGAPIKREQIGTIRR
jgi:hypothetical protein